MPVMDGVTPINRAIKDVGGVAGEDLQHLIQQWLTDMAYRAEMRWWRKVMENLEKDRSTGGPMLSTDMADRPLPPSAVVLHEAITELQAIRRKVGPGKTSMALAPVVQEIINLRDARIVEEWLGHAPASHLVPDPLLVNAVQLIKYLSDRGSIDSGMLALRVGGIIDEARKRGIAV